VLLGSIFCNCHSCYKSGIAIGQYAALCAAVWWFAPFFSGGGYASEAIDLVLALHGSPTFRPDGIWATQHGDGIQRGVLQVDTAQR